MSSTPPRSLLQQAQLRVTRPRLAVLEQLHRHPHSDADTIATLVRDELGTVSTQAIYNVLAALTEHDIIRRFVPAGSSARYEMQVGDNHHHLICRSCGDIVDVDCAVGERPCLDVEDDHGYDIDEAEVIYWGRCPRCASGATEATDATRATDASRATDALEATDASGATEATDALEATARLGRFHGKPAQRHTP